MGKLAKLMEEVLTYELVAGLAHPLPLIGVT
jgi:hypothetical protein